MQHGSEFVAEQGGGGPVPPVQRESAGQASPELFAVGELMESANP